MCEFATKLVAWLDRELDPAEAAAVERHVAECPECRELAKVYQDVSLAFARYREDAALPQDMPRSKRRPPILAIASAVAAAAAIVLFFAMSRSPEQTLHIDVAPPPAPTAFSTEISKPSAPVIRAHTVTRKPVEVQNWIPVRPTIQIAIPSDALFAPGAVPDGFAFAADLSLAADGSPAVLVLKP